MFLQSQDSGKIAGEICFAERGMDFVVAYLMQQNGWPTLAAL